MRKSLTIRTERFVIVVAGLGHRFARRLSGQAVLARLNLRQVGICEVQKVGATGVKPLSAERNSNRLKESALLGRISSWPLFGD